MRKKILSIFIVIFFLCALKLHSTQSVASGFICGANPWPESHLSMASQSWLSGAWASTNNNQTQGDSFLSGTNPPGGVDPMSKVPVTIISLILVGGLAYLILTFMGNKKWLPKMQAKNIKIIERMYLGPKHSLFIIKALNDYLLIGAADNSINTLKELNKEDVEKFLNSETQNPKIDPKDYWSKFFSTRINFKK